MFPFRAFGEYVVQYLMGFGLPVSGYRVTGFSKDSERSVQGVFRDFLKVVSKMDELAAI